MMRSSFVLFVGLGFSVAAAHGADATAPIDFTQRNAPYATGSTVESEKRRPVIDETVQQKRVTPDVIDKKSAPISDRRAAIDLTETRAKVVHEKDVRLLEKIDVPKSRYDQQRSRFSTSGDQTKPPTVAKYQDSLSAASATNMARFPAMKEATTAKINRFVFRKNAGELADSAKGATVVPAAGGATPRR
jgi:hypothetical protein